MAVEPRGAAGCAPAGRHPEAMQRLPGPVSEQPRVLNLATEDPTFCKSGEKKVVKVNEIGDGCSDDDEERSFILQLPLLQQRYCLECGELAVGEGAEQEWLELLFFLQILTNKYRVQLSFCVFYISSTSRRSHYVA
ncbi:hypothetical protein NDU88_002670 [Pleurodeles waltl]|uniref:Uncharacterized protein n=1 Tax=Pleurodeles waltl TaxID=8319 RepID=A0AAV7W595_PLEWA|nr:hypothetical protein NDU88_002670 [Pleurodeles waltl]